MQSVEALQRLIQLAVVELGRNGTLGTDAEEMTDHERELQLSASICQAMLNTALPVARFRAFVEVDGEQPKRSAFQDSVAVKNEFTICAVDMSGIVSGLWGVTHIPTNCKITVWEQRATGADMISGYQGQTKTANYRIFLKALPELETMPSVN